MDNIVVDEPVLTTSTRGDVSCTIEVSALDHGLHSGLLGGGMVSLPRRSQSGGSIPLLSTMSKAVPGTEFISWGAEDVVGSRIRSGNESVDASEIELMIVAEALLMQRLGETR